MLKLLMKIVLSLFVLVFLAALLFPIIYKDKIVAKLHSTIDSSVNAKITFGDVDLGIIRSFPNLSLQINDLVVVGVDSFATDTLANIQEFNLVIDIMSVIKAEQIKIKKLNLDHSILFFKVLKSGKANWDIAKTDTTQKEPSADTTTNFKIALKSYSITSSTIIYDDQSLSFYTELKDINHEGL